MSFETRTERRQARRRRNLVIAGVLALASVLSVSLLLALLTGGGVDQPVSAKQPDRPSTSAWTPTDDEGWSEGPSTTSVPTSSASGRTPPTGVPAATTTDATTTDATTTVATTTVATTTVASRRTAVSVARTTRAPGPAAPAPATAAATVTRNATSPTSHVPPGQLKRPKPKTTPPPRR